MELTESQYRVLMALEENSPLSYLELAEMSGLSYDGVRGRVSELVAMGINIERTREGRTTMVAYEPEESTPDYRKKLEGPRSYGDLVGSRHKSLEDFYGIAKILNDLREKNPIVAKKKASYGFRTGLLVLSDWHIGQVIKQYGEEIYNSNIAKSRLNEITQEVLGQLHMNDVDQLYIAMLGDMVDGDMVYKNHTFHIDKPAIEQVKDAVSAMTKMINTFREHDIFIEVGCVRGNHGITNYKNLETDNWDNVVYDMLNLVYSHDENVVIYHYVDNEARVDIMDRAFVMMHGNQINEQIKTSSGLKTFRGLCAKHKLRDGDFMLVGHNHAFGVESDQDKLLIRNGSLPDANEYALSLNMYGTPMQTLMILEEDKKYPTIIPIEIGD